MEQIQKGRNITIWQGYENRTYVSSIYDEHEFFYPAYCQAAQCINEIVDMSQRYQQGQLDLNSGQQEFLLRPALSTEQELLSYPNNVVGFCAKRGQGKTSAMVSVAKALEKMDQDRNDNKVRQFWGDAGRGILSTADRYSYSVVDPIDPTTMEQNDSVLRNVLSRLFTKFCEMWEQQGDDRRKGKKFDCSEESKEELLKTFTKCFQSLDDLKLGTAIERYDDLTRLSEVGDSVRMKKDFAELVRVFLKAAGTDMLVIQIDDADLNTARTFGITEDIRRYCVVPQVIVLMAVHLGTLRSCIEQQNVKSYEYLLRTDLDIEHLDRNQCREMAERYVDKLLPGLHQVHLPYVEDEIRKRANEPNLYYRSRDGKDLLDFAGDDERRERYAARGEKLQYVNRLIRLVYEKTGILLMATGGYMHNFMPKRTRELTHFLSFFSSLDDVEPSGMGSLEKLLELIYRQRLLDEAHENKELTQEEKRPLALLRKRIHNLEELETHFLQHWCAVNLTKSQVGLIEEIMHATRSEKHAKTLECIWRYQEEQGKIKKRKESLVLSQDPVSLANVTYVDVIQALNDLKAMWGYEKHYEFIYAIQFYYTIFMNKLVCTCLSQGRDLGDLLSFCGDGLFPRQLYEAKSKDSFSGRFEFNPSLLAQAAREHVFTNEDLQWSRFVARLGQDRQPFLIHSQDQELGVYSINKAYKTAQFDMFSGLIRIVEEFGDNVWRKETDIQAFCKELASVLQLICNYDLQHRVRNYCLEPGLGQSNSKGDYSDWVARLFQTIDALVLGEDLVSASSQVQEIKLQMTHQGTVPVQWLPVASCLCNLVDRNDLIRSALNAMYNSQEDQHRKCVISVIETIIDKIGKVTREVIRETTLENQYDWWIDPGKNLLNYLQTCLDGDKTVAFQTVFFSTSDDEKNIQNKLQELFNTLECFDKEPSSYTGTEIQDTLSQYQLELNDLTGNSQVTRRIRHLPIPD